ncbi:MAG: TfoX/Sxy family protein [Azovibrio sp.]|nr:TfoX/Sxy family protein [Azovibrio sp.]
MASDEFTLYLCDRLRPLGPLQVRRMFSGHGLFQEGAMFGLVLDEVLYLKADAGNLPLFQARGMEPFVYQRQGRPVRLSFHAPDAEAMEDDQTLLALARLALAAAHRARAGSRTP